MHLTRSTRRALTGLAVCLSLIAAMLVGSVAWLHHQLGEIDRIDGVFDSLGTRPERPVDGPGAAALTLTHRRLLLGLIPRTCLGSSCRSLLRRRHLHGFA